MKGITQPSEGHVKSRPRSSSGSPTKIESRFIIRKVHFHSLREKKEKIMARMKIKKVIVIQFSPGTEWIVHLIEKFETSLSLGWLYIGSSGRIWSAVTS